MPLFDTVMSAPTVTPPDGPDEALLSWDPSVGTSGPTSVGDRPTSSAEAESVISQQSGSTITGASILRKKIEDIPNRLSVTYHRMRSSISAVYDEDEEMKKAESGGIPLTFGDTLSSMGPIDEQAIKAYNRVRCVHYAQITLLAIVFFTCSTMVYCTSQMNYVTGNNDCLLDAEWEIIEQHNMTPSNVLLHMQSKWGAPTKCDWTQYGFVGIAITAFMMCWFFMLFRPYQEAFVVRRSTSATRLVLPTVALTFIFFVCTLVVSVMLTNGVHAWCEHLESELEALDNPRLPASCRESANINVLVHEQDVDPSQHEYDTRNFYGYALAAQIFAWLSAVIWLAAFLLVTTRFALHLDFPSYYFAWSTLENQNITAQNTNANANTDMVISPSAVSTTEHQVANGSTAVSDTASVHSTGTVRKATTPLRNGVCHRLSTQSVSTTKSAHNQSAGDKRSVSSIITTGDHDHGHVQPVATSPSVDEEEDEVLDDDDQVAIVARSNSAAPSNATNSAANSSATPKRRTSAASKCSSVRSSITSSISKTAVHNNTASSAAVGVQNDGHHDDEEMDDTDVTLSPIPQADQSCNMPNDNQHQPSSVDSMVV